MASWTVIISIIVCSLVSTACFADQVRLNIGDSWKKPDNVTWIGRLQKIDAETDLATFYYVHDGKESEFAVHVTRIVYIEFNSQFEMDKNYPDNTTKDVAARIEANPLKDRERSILLENKAGETEGIIPQEVRASPITRQGPDIRVFGIITYADDRQAILIVSKRDGRSASLTIDRQILKNWVREY